MRYSIHTHDEDTELYVVPTVRDADSAILVNGCVEAAKTQRITSSNRNGILYDKELIKGAIPGVLFGVEDPKRRSAQKRNLTLGLTQSFEFVLACRCVFCNSSFQYKNITWPDARDLLYGKVDKPNEFLRDKWLRMFHATKLDSLEKIIKCRAREKARNHSADEEKWISPGVPVYATSCETAFPMCSGCDLLADYKVAESLGMDMVVFGIDQELKKETGGLGFSVRDLEDGRISRPINQFDLFLNEVKQACKSGHKSYFDFKIHKNILTTRLDPETSDDEFSFFESKIKRISDLTKIRTRAITSRPNGEIESSLEMSRKNRAAIAFTQDPHFIDEDELIKEVMSQKAEPKPEAVKTKWFSFVALGELIRTIVSPALSVASFVSRLPRRTLVTIIAFVLGVLDDARIEVAKKQKTRR